MKRAIIAATAMIFASAVSAFAISSVSIVKLEVAALGFDKSVVESLTQEQVDQLSREIHTGEDSERHHKIRSLLMQFDS